MEQTCIHEGKIGRMEEAIENLQGWQKRQNGNLCRVEEKLERLQYWLMGVMATSIFTAITLIIQLLRGR